MEFFLLTLVSMQAVWRSVLFPSQPPLQSTAGTPSSFPPSFHPLTESFLPPRCVHLFNEHLLAFSSMPGSRLGTEKVKTLKWPEVTALGFFTSLITSQLSKCFWPSQASPLSPASISIYSFTQEQDTQLGIFLWSPQNWQHPGDSSVQEDNLGLVVPLVSSPTNHTHDWPWHSSPQTLDPTITASLPFIICLTLVLQAAGSPRTVYTHTDTSLPPQAGTLELRGLPVLPSPTGELHHCGLPVVSRPAICHFESSPLLPSSSALLPSIHLFS